jgi:predicted Fe-Mo cluster-binding NifX family protein
MKVIIPVINKDTQKYTIAEGLNDTECICVYDTLDNNIVWFEKTNITQATNELLPMLVRNEMMHVVTKGMQPLALNVLNRCGFTVYKSYGDDLMLNIELFNKECLPIFNMDHAMSEAQTCGSKCSSCSSVNCKN